MEIRVGQNVLYHPPGTRKELAAIVTLVHPNGFVNLAIFDPSGNVHQNPPAHIEVVGDNFVLPTSTHSCSLYDRLAHVELTTGPLATANKGLTLEEMRPSTDANFIAGLPPGAEVIEHRAATPDEIAKANKATEKNPPKPKKLTNG